MTARRRVAVVGAGVAGLTAARQLARSFDVVVLDKGRGVGGRLATRRVGNATFDHGAQFITTHTEAFAETVAGWERAGVARSWFQDRIGPEGIVDPDGHARFRGDTTMSAIAKHLADGLDVRVNHRIVALERSDAAWRVYIDGGSELLADAVVISAPVPQALALLHDGAVRLSEADGEAMRAIRYEPCLAVLAPLHGPSGLAEPGAIDPADGPIDWMADNQIKGISALPAVTIQATAEFSRLHWDASDEFVIAELIHAAGFGSEPLADLVQVHRWRYSPVPP